MKLKFDEVMRLLLLASGVVFFGVGVWMIKTGISVEGSIDIRSAVLSGSLKTGSAGLFIAFMSFFMIITSVLFSKWPAMSRLKTKESRVSSTRIMLRILFIIYGLTIGAYLLARSASGDERLFFGFVTAAFIGLSVLFSVFTFVGWLEDEATGEKQPAQKTSKT